MTDGSGGNRGKERPLVLVIDDYDDTLALLRVFFEIRDCDVLEGRSGEEAVSLVKEHAPDLVVLDLQLTGMDGISALKEIRGIETRKQIPVIITSGHAGDDHKKAATDAGCNEYIVKPIEIDLLERLLEKYLF